MNPELRRKQVEEAVERLRKNCHDNYNGGHHEDATNAAFHHGMDTVCNASVDFILSLLSDAERKGAWAVVRAQEDVLNARGLHSEAFDTARQVASSFGTDPEGK